MTIMRPLEQETDVEILREYIRLLEDYAKNAKEESRVLREKYEAQEQKRLNVEDDLKILRRKLWRRSSERRQKPTDRERDQENIDLTLQTQTPFPAPRENELDIEKRDAVFDLSPAELEAESKLRGLSSPSASQWFEIEGLFDKKKRIHIIERQYIEETINLKKYKLKPEYNNSDKEVIVAAKGPEELLPGSSYSIDFSVSVASDKYVSHMPLARQTKEMASLGLKGMKTSTLSHLTATLAALFEPLQLRILKEILSHDVIHCDETTWPIQIKEQDDGYMWVTSNKFGSYYCFEPTRSGRVVAEILKDFKGTSITDGYGGYNRLRKFPDIIQAFCWAHVRRKFFDLEPVYAETEEILDLIDKMFAIERQAKNDEDLLRLRKTKSKELLEKIHAWLLDQHPKARGESGPLAAIEYTLNLWDGLIKFTENPRIALSNNEAERTIRHAVMGRKNYYGSRTHTGADTAATFFTIVESCKKVELDPRTYMLYAAYELAAGNTPLTPLQYTQHNRHH
jgi:transposase